MIYRIIKRILDILFSILLIILTSWIMLILCIITYFDSGLPILDIRFPREGKNKVPFYMYKIRTRVYKGEKSIFTKFGKWLDDTGLNELPQLFNILFGDMSFIGPRAFICNEPLPVGVSSNRYLVRPGVMGLAQTLGGKDLPYIKKFECDSIYYDHFGFIQDVKIFIKSVKQIFTRLIGK